MLEIIKTPEDLWQECSRLIRLPCVLESELYKTTQKHFVLAYGPVAQRNQFQALLYSAQSQFNVSVLPIHDFGLFGEIPWPGEVICHFHWLHDRTKQAKTEAKANEAVLYWKKLLLRIKENGHKIVWTVHNVLPHETVWIEQDKKIHQMMADAADALHVMASDSITLTESYYTLDERKAFVVPHPTYEGAQPDDISRTEARNQLQIEKDEFVFLSFGAILEYKGYDRLMAAYDRLRSKTGKRLRLIIAGLPSDKELVKQIRTWGGTKPDVILDMAPVPNDKLQVYFRAADIAVCPYRRTLNSGVAMMALTFGLPVLGPKSGGFLDMEAMGCGMTFDNLLDSDLFDKMLLLSEMDSINKNKMSEYKRKLSPSVISFRFFRELTLLLD